MEVFKIVLDVSSNKTVSCSNRKIRGVILDAEGEEVIAKTGSAHATCSPGVRSDVALSFPDGNPTIGPNIKIYFENAGGMSRLQAYNISNVRIHRVRD